MRELPQKQDGVKRPRFPTQSARRGGVSDIARVSRGVIAGFGIFGYYLALRGVKDLLAAR